jgi:acyl-CoA synthetase (AMP-forming)/AMP-acid ligase II
VLKATAAFGVTGISAVPAVWLDMIRGRVSFDTSAAHRRLRYITLSGGDLPDSQLQEIPRLAPGVQIFKTYGQTETFRSTALLPHEFESRRTSVGRPFAGARVYVVRPNGTSCDPMEEGEIIHAGLGVMLGYLDGQDPQRKLRANPFQDTSGASHAVFTGDRGYFDSDGYLFLRGRSDAMVKIAGNRVYPEEVAIQLVEAGALEAQVLPVTASDGQIRLIAFVVAGKDPMLDLPRRLPAYMMPWKIHNIAAIPRTANGKPDRPRLLELAIGTELSASLP